MRLTVQLTDKQKPFVDDTARKILFLAGRGSGKTYAGAYKSIKWMSKNNTVGIISAPTYKQLNVAKDMLWEILNEVKMSHIEKHSLFQIKRNRSLPSIVTGYNKTDNVLQTAFNSTVYFRSADNPDALRGYNLDWYWADEGALFPELAIKNLDLCLRNSNAAQGYISTTPKGFSWLYDTLSDYNVYKASSYDNPYLPESFISDLPGDGNWRLQEVFGEFIEMEGLVFSDSDYEIAELTDIGRVYSTVAGVDFGYKHPASVIYIMDCLTPLGRRNYVYKELYNSGMTISDLYNVIKSNDMYQHSDAPIISFRGYYADPSRPDHIEDLRRLGLVVTKANNDVLYGIDKVKRARPIINPNCVNLISELKQYVWDKNSKPVKSNDDAIDALRYGIVAMSVPNARGVKVSFGDTDSALIERLGNNKYANFDFR